MKTTIRKQIASALEKASEKGALNIATIPDIEVEVPKVEAHGDFSTNIAMILASSQKMPPRKIAEAIIANLEDPEQIIAKTEIAGPGFINFYMKASAWIPFLTAVHDLGGKFGASNIGKGHRIQVEFVSSNPTGPLHVGHGRGAAVGDSVGNILDFCGYDVQKEYYINDSGRQIQTLGTSVFLRYKEVLGEAAVFPDECYQGDYIKDIAGDIERDKGRTLLEMDEIEAIGYCARYAANLIIGGIREDLSAFGVTFDDWFSEQSLYDSGKVDQVIQSFKTSGAIYEQDGAQWFRTTDYGDEKDRVVVRKNGQTTYFASDIAYHQDKYDRGFETVIDVWGADHHGYIPRVTASVEASGYRPEQFSVILVQLVNLLRGGEPVAMSTRSGEFVTLNDVIQEVGCDAARFIFLTRHYESPLDFDLELAKKKTNDNPVYYVQYVHARISSIVAKGREKGIHPGACEDHVLAQLTQPEEINLIKAMSRYPETVRLSAENMEPHRVTYYLMNLASAFHSYYNKHRVLTDDPDLARARLFLVLAVKIIIKNGLTLLGVSAPEKM
ncbi:MAG: arginine--tRNA ligase [Deltaproteobacteria bacterium]|nr:arginine--tRNA ligase [Deltaproteobacteria bacterium]